MKVREHNSKMGMEMKKLKQRKCFHIHTLLTLPHVLFKKPYGVDDEGVEGEKKFRNYLFV